MTVEIHRPLLHQYEGSSGGITATTIMISGKVPHSSSRIPLQSRDPNNAGVVGSFHSSTDEYPSKDMAALNRLSNLESSNNENNKRVTNSSTNSYGSGHVRRNSSSEREPEPPTATPSAPAASSSQRSNSVPRPAMVQRSSSLTSTTMDEDSVLIEEKRRKVNGDGYTLHRYLRGRLLGKGGFAKVYLCTALDTNKTYAVKIVPKANLVKTRARQKLQAEIKIHRTLKHKHVCEYKHFFEDRQNCYILLELCHNQSMNEMIKRRKRLTEPETAYLMSQLLDSMMYLHAQFVIHRDLKLGNLFLDRNMNVKVGDLGLATKLDSSDEKRKTICGTPNYIAPEVIQGDKATRGHSFEVDIWSMGVIIYTCLVGKPPYEAKDVKATYQRILANEYSFPKDNTISENAKDLIRSMLQSKPEDRPSLEEIGSHPFFTSSSLPSSLPSNATHVAPIWEENSFGELVAVSSKKDNDVSKKTGLPRTNSSRRPFASRDVNVERAPERGSKPSKLTRDVIDVPGAVKNVLSAVMNVASKSPPTTIKPSFQVYDENPNVDAGKCSANHKTQQNRDADEELVSRTATLSLRPQTKAAAPSPFQIAIDPSPRPQPQASPVVASHQETDAAVLHSMIVRINTVLEITDSRVYTAQNAASLSLNPISRGGPTKWVNRYVDYTSKYGLGYLLNDGSSGVYFNDSTKTVLEADGDNFQYVERRKIPADGNAAPRKGEPVIEGHTLINYPDELQKKVTLLKHFRNYLIEQQKKSDEDEFGFASAKSPARPRSHKQLVYLKKWVRTKHAIFFRLSDQTVQIVFYDHTEVLLTPDERHITYVDKQRNRSTYFLTDELVGCNPEIAKRVRYTKEILQQLVAGQQRN